MKESKVILISLLITTTLTHESRLFNKALNSVFPEPIFPNIITNQPASGLAKTFYILTKARQNPETAPLLFWIPGGPGGSGLSDMPGIGPFRFDRSGELVISSASLNNKYNVVWLDIPYDAGFSRVGTDADWIRARKDMVNCIQDFWPKFLNNHPEFKDRDVYFNGVSYAGHWTPYLARTLYELGANVKGVAIGNGLINPFIMVQSYPEFAWTYKNYTRITREEVDFYQQRCDLCVHFAKLGAVPLTYSIKRRRLCFLLAWQSLGQLLMDRNPWFHTHDMNYTRPYTLEDGTLQTNPPKPVNHWFEGGWFTNKGQSPVAAFYNREDVKAELGVDYPYNQVSFTAFYAALEYDVYSDPTPDLEFLINNGVKTSIYYGDMDMICNYAGAEQNLDELKWIWQDKWKQTELTQCKYGLCKEVANLRYIRMRGAGHFTFARNLTKSYELFDELVDWQI